ncbi:hypothetical protein Cal7507_4555 [Calothrix sp. PCC 7507]|nr:hypothetical protein Cal7507_4555 [Calothrix sp. PCC 7507]
MRVCKISYFEKYHNQLLYERMRKFSHMASLVVETSHHHGCCTTTFAQGESEDTMQ